MGRARMVATCSCIGVSSVLAVAYNWPYEFVRRAPEVYVTAPPKNLASYIERLTIVPVWPMVFGISALLLIYAFVFSKKFLPVAHVIFAAFMVGYASSLWITAIANPGTYIVSAVLASFPAAISFAMGISYKERPAK